VLPQKYSRFQVKGLPFLTDFNRTYIFSLSTFEKSTNITFHGNPASENRIVPCVQTDGRTDMTKLTVAFRDSEKAPKRSNFPVHGM